MSFWKHVVPQLLEASMYICIVQRGKKIVEVEMITLEVFYKVLFRNIILFPASAFFHLLHSFKI